MAKLSAHGNEIGRVEKFNTLQDSGTRYRETFALMADGIILRKVDFYGQYPHGTGWKRYARLRENVADVRWFQQKYDAGYTRV